MQRPMPVAELEPPMARGDAGASCADLPAYAEPLFSPKRYKVLYGGRGAARSWSVARALLIKAAQSTLRIGCFREFQKSIKDSVHRLLKDQIDLLELPGYHITDHELRHVNGSLFIFEGLRQNVTKIKSLEGIDIAWVEEAERVSKTSWDVLIPTIRKPGSEIWVTYNPDLEDDPTHLRFAKRPPPNAWVKQVSASDNPWFPAELAAERAYLYAVDPDAADHVWGGHCRTASAAQILRDKWRVEAFEPVTEASLVALHGPRALDDATVRAQLWDGPYHGADFGFANDPNTLVRCWIAPGTIPHSTGRLMIEYEAYKIGQDTDHIPPDWSAAVPGAERYAIRGDSARPETISYLARHGFPGIIGVDKWSGSVEDGIAHLRQYERIIIHARCTHAIDEAKHYSYKVDPRTGDVLPEIVDLHNHIWDAVRYALAPLIKGSGTGMLDYYARQLADLTARQEAHAHGRY
jgi:phage terminase large subunit